MFCMELSQADFSCVVQEDALTRQLVTGRLLATLNMSSRPVGFLSFTDKKLGFTGKGLQAVAPRSC